MSVDKNEMYKEESLEAAVASDEDEAVEEVGDSESDELSLTEEELTALCKEHVCPLCEVGKEAEEFKLRLLADSENLKKRLCKEADDIRKYAGESVLADFLPVLDNLDLALAHAEGLELCKDFVVGVDMTRKIFLDTMKKHGLEPAGVEGEEFNPQYHEALGVASDPNMANGQVAQVVQKGYILKGRLLRPAKVMVNKLEQ